MQQRKSFFGSGDHIQLAEIGAKVHTRMDVNSRGGSGSGTVGEKSGTAEAVSNNVQLKNGNDASGNNIHLVSLEAVAMVGSADTEVFCL